MQEVVMRNQFVIAAPLAVLIWSGACEPHEPTSVGSDAAGPLSQGSVLTDVPGVHRQYGPPVTLGEGKVRAYVVLDARHDQMPIEVGVAIDARVVEGELPGSEMLSVPITLPAQAPAPYHFVLFDWNPHGHVPPGVFDPPHFDFHFYLVPRADVEAIVRSDPSFTTKANNLPTGDFVPPNYIVGKPPFLDAAAVAVPGMGVHWQDLLSPEYQLILGNPAAYRPFTKTYVYVSWDGRFTALEPMVTREYLLRKTNEVIPVRQPARYSEPGWYPSAYRITYDSLAQEYRVALVELNWRD
jgi:hypothetical protein